MKLTNLFSWVNVDQQTILKLMFRVVPLVYVAQMMVDFDIKMHHLEVRLMESLAEQDLPEIMRYVDSLTHELDVRYLINALFGAFMIYCGAHLDFITGNKCMKCKLKQST